MFWKRRYEALEKQYEKLSQEKIADFQEYRAELKDTKQEIYEMRAKEEARRIAEIRRMEKGLELTPEGDLPEGFALLQQRYLELYALGKKHLDMLYDIFGELSIALNNLGEGEENLRK